MKDDPKLNASIRAKLLERYLEYGIWEKSRILDACWDSYEAYLTGDPEEEQGTGKVLTLFQEWVGSLLLTPEELHYIHTNLSPEAWGKLGLELPKPEKLEYTIPELNAKEREHVKTIVGYEGGVCNGLRMQRGEDGSDCRNACYPIMGKIFTKAGCPFSMKAKGSPQRAQIIGTLNVVLEKQKPLLPPHKNSDVYTKTPPEEFKPYLAVRLVAGDDGGTGQYAVGKVMRIVKKAIDTSLDSVGYWHSNDKIAAITNHHGIHALLHELERKAK